MTGGTAGNGYGAELGNHTFLPWLRRGIATEISRADGSGGPAPRATIDVAVGITGGPLSTAQPGGIQVSLNLSGPGDIKGLDPAVVIRTWPQPDVPEAEPNYFPSIDLDPADLPWRYTPARPNAKDRLRPWLALIVLRADEIVTYFAPSAKTPTGVVTVASGSSLPPLEQSWAWAHVQVTGQPTLDPASALTLLDYEPHRIIARLLAPRRLDERTAYTAFLVPCLERARLAGLGQTVDDATDGLALAWTPADNDIQLPVYYSWNFTTGLFGDFESLARRVVPRPLPKEVGSRPMNVADPGLGLPRAAAAPLNVEAALRALTSESTPWSDADRTTWTPPLQAVLNRPATLLASAGAERILAPPLYGRWYAARDTVDAVATPDWWFSGVNVDVRNRVAAGTGTQVVQQSQQQFLAGAWAQVEGIRAANAALRQAQLAREAAIRLYERHVIARTDDQLISFTTPVHSRIPMSPTTAASVIRSSPLAIGILSPAYRRLTRPRGPLGQRIGSQPAAPAPGTVLDRVNSGSLRPAPPPAVPSTMVTPSRAGRDLVPAWASPQLVDTLGRLSQLSFLQLLMVFVVALALFLIGVGEVALILAAAAVLLKAFGSAATQSAGGQEVVRRMAVRDGTLTAAQIRSAPPRPQFVPREFAAFGGLSATPPSQPLAAGTTEQPAAARFRQAAAALFAEVRSPNAPGPVVQAADLTVLRAKIVAALHPAVTVETSYRTRLKLTPTTAWNPPDALDPVMAAPVFTDPMYRPLYKLSSDWVLPGLELVPRDTVSLARTNQPFIETYMLGANHEMARTLLFNEYPTDQRGTYFRQFWDVSAVVPSAGQPPDPGALLDIEPIDKWGNTSLGQNSRTPPNGGSFLVLLLRAELLRRYPNTVVYATRAKWKQDGTRDVDDSTEQSPVFSGTLSDGVGFWGFALTTTDVRGGPSPKDDPGWFFILQEPPTEPRCGLEPATVFGGAPDNWEHLSWAHLAANATDLQKITYVDLDAALPDTTAVADPKGAAWHADAGTGRTGARASDLAYITYRVPMRVAIHGSQMIPPELEAQT